MFSLLEKKVMQVTPNTFEDLALEIFRLQASENKIYNKYLQLLNIKISDIKNMSQIPTLPVSCFKYHRIITGDWNEEQVFHSSGTTGMIPSKHLVKSHSWYEQVILKDIKETFGTSGSYQFYALLPGYLDNPNSSLISMMRILLSHTKQDDSNYFYKKEYQQLNADLIQAIQNNHQIILFGVSFALYDFAKEFTIESPNLSLIETGGLKSSNRQYTKLEILETLQTAFPKSPIYSEYGMTEMMSQAYSYDGMTYTRSSTMDLIVTSPNDPKEVLNYGKRGKVNIIDLGNLHTCSFLQTGDLGIKLNDTQFQILGRLDDEEIRGCNMLFE